MTLASGSGLTRGTVIAERYRIDRVIGRGGFGTVYAGRHLATGQDIAAKVLRRGSNDESNLLQRFLQEAQVTASLTHPNTVRVFDFGQDAQTGVIFLIMELLNGRSVRTELKRRLSAGEVFSQVEAAHIGIAVARSLSEAHAAGLVHRDLKPDNIFLHEIPGDEVAIKVLDFGVAKLRDVALTRVGSPHGPGTPAYMSPEQASGQPVDGRSDLYGLGLILYELVCGERAFAGSTPLETLFLQVNEPTPSLSERAGGRLDEGFIAVVDQLTRKAPDQRFADAQALRRSLDPYGASRVR